MRFINGGVPERPGAYDVLLPRMLAFEGKPYGFFAALEGSDFIGWFHLRPSAYDPRFLELGYRLVRRAWGKGLATEGSSALVDHAFQTLACDVVDACAMPENRASIHVMRKLGMVRSGAFLHPRGRIWVVRYAMRREVYLSQRSAAKR